jgi:hypothetical protein
MLGVECYEVVGYKVEARNKECAWSIETPTFESEEEVLKYMESHKEKYTFAVYQIRKMIVSEA